MVERYQITGFLPWRAPFMLDVIIIAMVFVLIALAWSVCSVKYRNRYQRHKVTQLCLTGGLLILLVFFEIDIQFFEPWRERADASPYYDAATRSGLAVYSLWIHLFFATTTLALWLLIIVRALIHFPNPPRPNSHSRFHARWGMVAAVDMLFTAVTGWFFYFLAFVA
jgi:putative membrane protein